ncbi:MAG: VOC family protein [Chloroflexi bacterium]|nr:VOC family protein [Chloroflexota bacterium]
MHIESIYHTGFVVRDLQRSLEFYTGLLGMRVERGPAESDSPWLAEVVGYPSVRMRMAYVGVGDGHSIELIEYIEPSGEPQPGLYDRNRPGSAHAAMVVDDVRVWRERLEAQRIIVFGPRQVREMEFPWARLAIYFQDPDGNWLEMVERGPKPEGSLEN